MSDLPSPVLNLLDTYSYGSGGFFLGLVLGLTGLSSAEYSSELLFRGKRHNLYSVRLSGEGISPLVFGQRCSVYTSTVFVQACLLWLF